MSRVFAIAGLTIAEGVRMRIVVVFLALLGLIILRLPFVSMGDGTQAGKLQTFLAYSLSALSVLLSLTVIFFACQTLAGEIKNRSLQTVVTKPVSRLQVLLGKWLGVNALAWIVLGLSGAAIYGLALHLYGQPATNERDQFRLQDTVWTARVAATPATPVEELLGAARQSVRELIERGQLDPEEERVSVERKLQEGVNRWRRIEDGEERFFAFSGLKPPERDDATIQIRYKVIAAPLTIDEMIDVGWAFCDPNTRAFLGPPIFTRERSNQTHQFLAFASRAIVDGRCLLAVHNPPDQTSRSALVFEGDRSLEILYRVGGFELNFVRNLALLAMRLSLLSAVSLFFCTFVSFPVACFCTLSFFLLCIGSPFFLESVGAELDASAPARVDPFGVFGKYVRPAIIPTVKAVFPDFVRYDGTRSLIDGLLVGDALLAEATLRIIGVGAILLLGVGWLIFTQREIAEAQT